jgi:hypothetical protein
MRDETVTKMHIDDECIKDERKKLVILAYEKLLRKLVFIRSQQTPFAYDSRMEKMQFIYSHQRRRFSNAQKLN